MQPEAHSSFSSSADADVLRAQLADERQQIDILSKQSVFEDQKAIKVTVYTK